MIQVPVASSRNSPNSSNALVKKVVLLSVVSPSPQFILKLFLSLIYLKIAQKCTVCFFFPIDLKIILIGGEK
jgi:hypothetical protein